MNIQQKSTAGKVLIPVLLVFLLTACGSATVVPPTVTPVPVWIKLQFSPSLDSLRADFNTCLPPDTGLAVQEAPGLAFPVDEADVHLVWASPEQIEGFASELGSEELVVIVHPQNEIPEMDLEDLRLVYSGELTDWDFLGQSPLPLRAYLLPEGSDSRQLFTEVVLEPRLVLGRAVAIAPSPESMREAVAADSGALGILPRRWVDDTVRTVPLADLPQGALIRPILALSADEPQGALRAWVACLQERVE
jgi:hypothetical protein